MPNLKVLELRPNTKPLIPAGDRQGKKIYILNEYSKAFKECLDHITVVYLEGEEDQEVIRRTVADRVIFLKAKKIKPFGKILPAAIRLRKILKKENFDIVIAHWLKPGMVLALATFFQKYLSKYLVMHGSSGIEKLRRRIFAYLFLRNRFIYLAVSEYMRQYLLNINWAIKKDQIITLYNAIDIQSMEKNHLSRQEVREKFGWQDKEIVFVTVGWLMEHKGHYLLLQALEMIAKEVPNLKMVIVGEGKLYRDLEQETRQRWLKDKVILAGGLADAYQYLPGFDAFVLPSLRESFGLVLLEAMAAKLPIIASKTGGIPEVMGSLPRLVPANNPQALAEAIKEYYQMSEQERIELGEEGYNRLGKNFSSQIFTQKLCSIVLNNL